MKEVLLALRDGRGLEADVGRRTESVPGTVGGYRAEGGEYKRGGGGNGMGGGDGQDCGAGDDYSS